MAADQQPMTTAEFDEARARGDFLPGGAGFEAWTKKISDHIAEAYDLPEGLRLEWGRDEQPDTLGHILKAALTSPPGALTYEPEGDRYADCPACGTSWEDCEASQPYADEEDPACCGGCEHKWLAPPPTYTMVNGCECFVLAQRGAPLYLEAPTPQRSVSPLKFFQFNEPEKPLAPHLEGGPWSAIEALRGSFVPWKGKP